MNKIIDEEYDSLMGGVKLLVENYEDTIDLLNQIANKLKNNHKQFVINGRIFK